MRFVMEDSPFNIIFSAFFRAFRKGEKTQYCYVKNTIFKAEKQATLREMPLNQREVTVLPQNKAAPCARKHRKWAKAGAFLRKMWYLIKVFKNKMRLCGAQGGKVL